MHILFLPSWYPEHPDDARGCFFREQAISLKKIGHKVGVLFNLSEVSIKNCMLGQWKKCGFRREIDQGVYTYRYCYVCLSPRLSRKPLQTEWLFPGVKLFRKYAKEFGPPDIIHVQSSLWASRLAIQIKKKYRISYVLTEHSSGFARGLYDVDILEIAEKGFEAASALIAVSHAFCDLLSSKFPRLKQTWNVLPNALSDDFVHTIPVPKKDRKPFVFFTLAALVPKKRTSLLIKAFSKSFFKSSEVELWIGGDGSSQGKLERLATEVGIAPKCKFLGRLNRAEVLETMNQADVFVLPSNYETFGVVVIEAHAMGKPVIATRCGGPEDTVNDKNGMLVEPENIEALARAMQRIISKIDDYCPKAIRQNCLQRYSGKVIAQKLSKIYASVLA